jgi:hypothetical protein
LASGSVSGSAGPSKEVGFKPLTAEQQAAAKGVLGTPTTVKEQPKVKPRQPQAEAQVFPTTEELMTQAGARPEAENAAFIPTVTPEDRQVLTDQTPKEQDYFLTREDTKLQEIGKVLQKFDEFTGLGFGDYVDDIARAADAGYRQGQIIAPALSLMMSGKNATPEQIQEYIDAAKYAEEIGPSTEMQDFRKIYEKEGKGVFGFLKGLANNPSVATEIALSSLVSLANKASAVTAGGVVGASGLVGGTATAEFGGIGAIPAMLAAVPEALAAASTTLETSSSFSEFLNQELKDRGLDFTKENVKSVLEDAKAVSRMRTKAIARGATIGIIDAITGRLAGAVGANLAGNTAASKIKSQLAAGLIEMGGGAGGEAAARGVTGQDMDVSEIGFEAAGNLGLGPINVAAETARRATQPATSPVINSARSIYAKAAAKILKKPVYKINGEVRPEVDVEETINTATPEELNNIKFEFTNDNKGYANIIQNKVVTGQIRNEVKEANPNLSDADVDKITELEIQLKKNEGNKTYTGKELNTSIKKQIKDIQENATVNVKPEGEDTFITMRYDEQGNEIKQEENAIQEPSTETGVLRTEQPEVGLPKVGEGNAQEQAITEEGGQVTPAKEGEIAPVISIAPFFDTQVANKQEAEQIRTTPEYKSFVQGLTDLGKTMGVTTEISDKIGGYRNDAGNNITEVSATVSLPNATIEQAEQFAALSAALTPNVQEASIAAKYTEEGAENHNANEYEFTLDDPNKVDEAIKALKDIGIDNFTADDKTGLITFIDVKDFSDEKLGDKIDNLISLFKEKNITYNEDSFNYSPIESRYIDKVRRQEIIRQIKSEGSKVGQGRTNLREALDRAIEQDSKFRGLTSEEYLSEKATAAKEEVEMTPDEKEALAQEVKDLEDIISGINPQFQLDTNLTPTEKKKALADEAEKLMIEAEKNGLSEEAFSASKPEPGVKTYKITVDENSKLAAKLKRMGLDKLVGKKINIVMADQLKVGSVKIGKKILERMGGPFFPLIDKLFGKVAWASININAARQIIKGAVKSDYTVVYNMNPSAIDSNIAVLSTFEELVKNLPKDVSKSVYEGIVNQLTGKKFGKKTDAVQKIVNESTDINSFFSALDKLDVDTIAKVVKNIMPSENVKAGTDLGKILQKNNITIEEIRRQNIEQFVADLPAGALTMVLEVTDKNGNKITSKNIDDAIITPDQQDKEGLPKHENYPIYIRGRAVALLEETVPFWNLVKDAMNTIDAKVAGIIKRKTRESYTSKEARSNEMRRASMKAGTAQKVTGPLTTQYEKFVSLVSRSFPNIEVVTDEKEFNKLASNLNAKKLATKNQNIYGAVYNGKLYLNPSLENYNTPIHEFGHIWLNVVKTANTELYQKGMSLIEGSAYIKQIKESKEYKKVIDNMIKEGATKQEIDEYIKEEALATAIGDKGESFVTAAQRVDFKKWIDKLFSFVRTLTGLSKYTSEQIQDITLEDFIQAAVVDIVSGEEVFAGYEQQGLTNALQLMTNTDETIYDIISMGRDNGFSDASIKEVLKGRGFKIDEINKAMEVNVDLLTPLPREFANVEGGVNEGMKLFNEVRDELNRFSTEGPRGGKGKTRTKTFAEIREKAMSLMQENPIFKRQTEQIQQELLTSFDKTLNTRSNPTVQKQIAAIRNNLKQRKIGANNLKAAQIAVKNFIRSVLPKSDMYSQAQINKLVAAVTDANVDTLRAVAEKVLNIVEQQREKMKDSVIKEMIVLSSKKSKPSMTASGKRRSGGLEEEGQAYFEAIAPVLKAYANNDEEAINKIEKILADTNAIDDVVNKAVNGEDLTTKETALLNTVLAHDMYSNINDMSLEQVQDLLEDMKVARTTSIDKLKMNRLVRAAENKAMSDAATAQVQKSMPILFNEFTDKDGNTTYELKNINELNRDKAEVWQAFRDLKVWDGLKKFIKVYDLASLNGLLKQIHDKLVHIETLCNVLDKKGTFFNDNVYRPLNRMEENAIAGQLIEMDRMDDMANSIDGITDGYNEIKRLLAQGIKTIEVNGKTEYLNHNQMLRIYALSKNDVQAEILYSMGYTPSKINEIKGMLGDQVVEFADKVVDYLSNSYYESVNDVYKYVNNVNLGYLNNYFPTRTINEKIQADMLAKGDFNGIFNAETAPALKERTNKVKDIDLGASFTSTLDDHIKSMERYKAYAEGVKKLNSLFSIPAVNTLLDQTAVKRAMKLNVNFAINPDAGLQQNKGISNKLLSKLQGVVLKFKLMQLPKQATSFINGFNEYSYSDKKIPGLDLTMFMVDVADVLRKLPSEIKKFEKISANFRSRVQAAKEGDMRALESGSHETQPLIDDYSFIGRMKKKFDIAGSAPITYGDIIGVAGYMAAYNRDIKNGMSKADALEKFNNYNATLQTRRPSEKIPLQQSQDIFYRVLTTFGSTAYLQMNKTLIASRNIARTLSEKKMPSKKDLRTFAVSLSVSNALFTTASYMFKYAQGDDEDWEDANKKLMESLLGLNLLYQIPLVGGAMEEMVAAIDGRRLQTDEGFNPYKESMKRINIAMKTEDTGIIVKTALEIATGVSMDPFIGLYKLFADDTTDTWEDIYDIIGVSKSYRPGYGKKEDSGLTKEQMKQYFPEEYEQMYGEGSPAYEAEQQQKEQARELKKMTDEAMGM